MAQLCDHFVGGAEHEVLAQRGRFVVVAVGDLGERDGPREVVLDVAEVLEQVLEPAHLALGSLDGDHPVVGGVVDGGVAHKGKRGTVATGVGCHGVVELRLVELRLGERPCEEP